MEDSVKGIYISFSIILIFILCVVSFITLFPNDQGVSFNNDSVYLQTQIIAQGVAGNLTGTMTNINTNVTTGFNQWDITQGFMGSNTVKQSTGTGFVGYVGLVFSTLQLMVVQVFGSNSPVFIVLGILSILAAGVVLILVIKFVRTGT